MPDHNKIIDEAFRRGLSNERILIMGNHPVSKEIISAYAVYYSRPELIIAKPDLHTLCKLTDDPSLLSNPYSSPILYSNCPRIIRYLGMSSLPSRMPCTSELCNYFHEIDMYPVQICSSSVEGLKLLAEKGIKFDISYVKLPVILWLYKSNKITREQLDSYVTRNKNTIHHYSPDILAGNSELLYDIPIVQELIKLVNELIS